MWLTIGQVLLKLLLFQGLHVLCESSIASDDGFALVSVLGTASKGWVLEVGEHEVCDVSVRDRELIACQQTSSILLQLLA